MIRFNKRLPENASLANLRRQASRLRLRHRRRDEAVCAWIGHFDLSLHGLHNDEILDSEFSILAAQRVIARRYGFRSWRRLKSFVEKSRLITADRNEGLRQFFLSREKQYKESVKTRKEFEDFNSETVDLMQAVYERYEYPGVGIVGRDGIEACMMLTGPTVYHADFQRRTVALMKRSEDQGGQYSHWSAPVSDRILSLSGKRTVYGLDWSFDETGRIGYFGNNVIDPDNLDRRRAQIGLCPLAVGDEMVRLYQQKMGADLYPNREEREAERREIAIKGGYI